MKQKPWKKMTGAERVAFKEKLKLKAKKERIMWNTEYAELSKSFKDNMDRDNT